MFNLNMRKNFTTTSNFDWLFP